MKSSYKMTTVALCLIATIGCGHSPKAKFYTLQPVSMDETWNSNTPYSVSVGRVTLPDMVDRPQLVVRAAKNRVEILESHRWADSLKSEIPRLIAENLRSQLGSDLVSSYHQNTGIDADYHVLLNILKFESVPEDGVIVDAFWVIRRTSGGSSKTGRSQVREQTGNDGYEAVVAAYSRALGIISGDIARAIRSDGR